MATCSVAPGTSCSSNANCDTSCGEECYPPNGECFKGAGAPCDNPSNNDATCLSYWCDASPAVCGVGYAIYDSWCAAQTDCYAGYYGVDGDECDPATYTCEAAPGTSCGSDSECVWGDTCVGGYCYAAVGTFCASATQCQPGPTDLECYQPPGQPENNECLLGPGGDCSYNGSNADCMSNWCLDGSCVCSFTTGGTHYGVCVTDADCCTGYGCTGGVCYAEADTSCGVQSDCDPNVPGLECYTYNGYDHCLIGGNEPCGGGAANTRDGTCISDWCGGVNASGIPVCYPGILDWWCVSQADCQQPWYECETSAGVCKSAGEGPCGSSADCGDQDCNTAINYCAVLPDYGSPCITGRDCVHYCDTTQSPPTCECLAENIDCSSHGGGCCTGLACDPAQANECKVAMGYPCPNGASDCYSGLGCGCPNGFSPPNCAQTCCGEPGATGCTSDSDCCYINTATGSYQEECLNGVCLLPPNAVCTSDQQCVSRSCLGCRNFAACGSNTVCQFSSCPLPSQAGVVAAGACEHNTDCYGEFIEGLCSNGACGSCCAPGGTPCKWTQDCCGWQNGAVCSNSGTCQ